MDKRCFTYCGDRCDCGAGERVLGAAAWAAILAANPGVKYDPPTQTAMEQTRFRPSRLGR